MDHNLPNPTYFVLCMSLRDSSQTRRCGGYIPPHGVLLQWLITLTVKNVSFPSNLKFPGTAAVHLTEQCFMIFPWSDLIVFNICGPLGLPRFYTPAVRVFAHQGRPASVLLSCTSFWQLLENEPTSRYLHSYAADLLCFRVGSMLVYIYSTTHFSSLYPFWLRILCAVVVGSM